MAVGRRGKSSVSAREKAQGFVGPRVQQIFSDGRILIILFYAKEISTQSLERRLAQCTSDIFFPRDKPHKDNGESTRQTRRTMHHILTQVSAWFFFFFVPCHTFICRAVEKMKCCSTNEGERGSERKGNRRIRSLVPPPPSSPHC